MAQVAEAALAGASASTLEHVWAARCEERRVVAVLAALATDAEDTKSKFVPKVGIPTIGEESCFDPRAAFTSWPCMEEPAYVFPFGGSQALQRLSFGSQDAAEPTYIKSSGLSTVATPALTQARDINLAGFGQTPPVSASDRGAKSRKCPFRLGCHLEDLEDEDAACIIHVRRIHKLGFKSPELLEKYCRQYGPVKRVLVSNVHDKAAGGVPAHYGVRVRPSGIGFVVMERQEDVQKIMDRGEKQAVCGCEILVRRFFARTEHHQESVDTAAVMPEADKASLQENCEKDYLDSVSATTFAPSVSTISDIDAESE